MEGSLVLLVAGRQQISKEGAYKKLRNFKKLRSKEITGSDGRCPPGQAAVSMAVPFLAPMTPTAWDRSEGDAPGTPNKCLVRCYIEMGLFHTHCRRNLCFPSLFCRLSSENLAPAARTVLALDRACNGISSGSRGWREAQDTAGQLVWG